MITYIHFDVCVMLIIKNIKGKILLLDLVGACLSVILLAKRDGIYMT